MKSLLSTLTILSLLLGTPLFLRSQLVTPKADWEIQVGWQSNNLQTEEEFFPTSDPSLVALINESRTEYTPKIGYFAGLFFQKPINQTFQFSSGLMLRYQQTEKEITIDFFDRMVPDDLMATREEQSTMETFNLSFPILLQTRLKVGKMKLGFGGGGYYNLKLRAQQPTEDITTSFYRIKTGYSADCDCAKVLEKAPDIQQNSNMYTSKRFSVHHVGVAGNVFLKWTLKSGNAIGLTYYFTQDLQHFYEDELPKMDLRGIGKNRYRSHQFGLTYELPKKEPDTFTPKSLESHWVLGASVYYFGPPVNGHAYGPALNVGYFFNDQSAFEFVLTLVDNPSTKTPVFNDEFQRIGVDVNYLYRLSNVFYAKIGLSMLTAPFVNPDLRGQGGTAFQIGASGLFPITTSLRLKVDVQPKLWVTDIKSRGLALGAKVGFVTIL